MLVDNCALFNNNPKPHAARTNAPGIRPVFPSTCLPRLACTTALTAVVLTFVPATAHAENPCQPTDEVRGHEENNPPAGTEITGIYYGCQYSDPGAADDATGVWSTNWSSDVNELTVRGSVEAVAGSSAGSAEARALNIGKDGNPWQGTSNILINYATITATAIGGGSNAGQGVGKSFGIYTDNWEGADNRLYNYGNVHVFSEGKGPGQTEAFAIRTGEWRTGTNVLHNWGDLDVEVYFSEGGNNDSSAVPSSTGIQAGGWSGENHELIN